MSNSLLKYEFLIHAALPRAFLLMIWFFLLLWNVLLFLCKARMKLKFFVLPVFCFDVNLAQKFVRRTESARSGFIRLYCQRPIDILFSINSACKPHMLTCSSRRGDSNIEKLCCSLSCSDVKKAFRASSLFTTRIFLSTPLNTWNPEHSIIEASGRAKNPLSIELSLKKVPRQNEWFISFQF